MSSRLILAALVATVMLVSSSGATQAATCTCSDEQAGGGNTASFTSQRMNANVCNSGAIIAYFASIGIVFQPGATCTLTPRR